MIVTLSNTAKKGYPTGVGTYFSPHRFVTAAHVLGRRKSLWVHRSKQPPIKAKLLYVNTDLDYAILETKEISKRQVDLLIPNWEGFLGKQTALCCPHEPDSPYILIPFYNGEPKHEDPSVRLSYRLYGDVLPPGTSGAPIFCDSQMVALHHGGDAAPGQEAASLGLPVLEMIEDLLKYAKEDGCHHRIKLSI